MRAVTQRLRAIVHQRRSLNPWAWWLWALSIAAAASMTTNPVLLALIIAVLWLVVTARRGSSPWARAFGLYLWVAGFIVVFRVGMHILVGLKAGSVVLVQLPSVQLPEWAAGITVLGTIYMEGVVQAGLDGLRLGTILIAVGAANSLANPTQLVRSLPAALGEVGTAVVIALSLAPQMAEALVRVRKARELRGESVRGLRGAGRLVLPVLQDTLDGALKLAASMDARGYGRRALVPTAMRMLTTGLSLIGLAAVTVGSYLLLDATMAPAFNVLVLFIGVAALVGALWLSGAGYLTTRYARIPWRGGEWVTALSGIAALVLVLATRAGSSEDLAMPLFPLAPPSVPVAAVLGLLLAALPAVLAPAPLPAARRHARRHKPQSRRIAPGAAVSASGDHRSPSAERKSAERKGTEETKTERTVRA